MNEIGDWGMGRFLMTRRIASMIWIKQRTTDYRMTKHEGWNRFVKPF